METCLATVTLSGKEKYFAVVEIRAVKYMSGEVCYEIRDTKEWKQLPQQRTKHNKVEPKLLYQEPLKIGSFRH